MSQSIRIYWDTKTQLFRINTPYNANFVDKLKLIIPYQERGWDAQTRTWAFTEAYLPQVQNLCDSIWPNCEIIFTSKYEAELEAARFVQAALPQDVLTEGHKHAIAFCENLDLEALGAAFKNRSKRLHPDAGGDKAKFQEFNSAYQALRELLK